MKVLESSNLSKLFAARLSKSDTPANQDKTASRIASGLASSVHDTLDAAKTLVAVSNKADPSSISDVASAVREASHSRPEDVDSLVHSLANRIPAHPQQALDAQAQKLNTGKIGELLR